MTLIKTPIATYIDNAILLRYQPALEQQYESGKVDFSNQISEAEYRIIQELKYNKRNLRKYTTPLTVQEPVAKSADFTGGKSAEDTINRLIFVSKTTALGSTSESFTLQGTDDESSETWNDIVTVEHTRTGTIGTRFKNVYKYYRVVYTAGTSATYEAYLVEASFFFAHLYKSLELIFRFLIATTDSYWEKMADYYGGLYRTEMDTMIATYDEDLDGIIDTAEQGSAKEIEWVR